MALRPRASAPTRAERKHLVAQLLGVRSEIQGRPAQVFVFADYVPENLANTDDAHVLCLLA